MLTGGEFVMGADTVRQYGLDFMGELNRGNVPGMAGGGPVSRGNQGAIAGMVTGGETNNNVNISINVDKRGNVEAKATQDPTESDNVTKENTVRDAETIRISKRLCKQSSTGAHSSTTAGRVVAEI